jgi:hypothetical protein
MDKGMFLNDFEKKLKKHTIFKTIIKKECFCILIALFKLKIFFYAILFSSCSVSAHSTQTKVLV